MKRGSRLMARGCFQPAISTTSFTRTFWSDIEGCAPKLQERRASSLPPARWTVSARRWSDSVDPALPVGLAGDGWPTVQITPFKITDRILRELVMSAVGSAARISGLLFVRPPRGESSVDSSLWKTKWSKSVSPAPNFFYQRPKRSCRLSVNFHFQ